MQTALETQETCWGVSCAEELVDWDSMEMEVLGAGLLSLYAP